MAEQNEDRPKIIVDTDWKEQARREKEEADRQTREASRMQGLPDPHIAEIIELIVMQASIGLGGFQDPQTGRQMPPQLPIAKHFIDLLELFQQKTSGNLSPEEKRLVDATLHELRLAFVQVAGVGAAGGDADAEQADQ